MCKCEYNRVSPRWIGVGGSSPCPSRRYSERGKARLQEVVRYDPYTQFRIRPLPPFQFRNMRTGHHTFVTMRQGRIAMSKFNYDFKHRISASCNGLILETLDDTDHNKSRKTLSVANPATNQRLPLPPLPLKMSRYWCSVIAYDAASLKYKVVVIYDRSWINIVHDCAILTVGVDKSWRDVNTQHISERNSWLLCCNVLITQGFVHWHSGQGTHVINLNLETEVLTEIRIPQGYDEQGSKYYLSTERSLTLFIECGRFLWDVWEMMNAEESGGEWTKVFKIDMEGPMWRLQKMMIHTSPHKPQTKWLVMSRRGARLPYTASDSGLRCLRCSYTRSRLLYVNHRLWWFSRLHLS